MADEITDLRRAITEWNKVLEKTTDPEERQKLVDQIKIMEDQLRRYQRGETRLRK